MPPTASENSLTEIRIEVGKMDTPRVLFEETLKCPMCDSYSLKITAHITQVEFFGELILETGRCSNCGYVYRDVYLAEYGEPKRLQVRVSKESGDYLLVKSSSATVIIPELGIEITPGPAAQGYITTARGILENIVDLLSGMCQEGDEECRRKLEELSRALKGEIDFTLILEDPLGRSTIVKLP
ncbi:MAG: ZPR1 zinc finger domain-containing protein [Sulfolobales archaeon]